MGMRQVQIDVCCEDPRCFSREIFRRQIDKEHLVKLRIMDRFTIKVCQKQFKGKRILFRIKCVDYLNRVGRA